MKSTQKTTPGLLETLKRLQSAVELPDDQWREILQLSQNEYGAVVEGRKPVPLVSIVSAAQRFHISMESFQDGKIDFGVVAAQFRGDLVHLPERYLVAPRSSRRNALNLLDYVESKLGFEAKQSIMRRFQLREAAFADPNGKINGFLSQDICSYLGERFHFSASDFHQAGVFACSEVRGKPIVSALGGVESLSKLYERFYVMSMFRFFSDNYLYSNFKVSIKGAALEFRTDPEISTLLSVKEIGNTGVCAFRGGVLAALPRVFGFLPAEIVETRCVHRGDAVCRYELSFEKSDYFNRNVGRLA